jgi:hypothetical protein
VAVKRTAGRRNFDRPRATVRGISGNLSNLGDTQLDALPGLGEALKGQLARVFERVNRAGMSISGFNGAGGYEDASAADDGLSHG